MKWRDPDSNRRHHDFQSQFLRSSPYYPIHQFGRFAGSFKILPRRVCPLRTSLYRLGCSKSTQVGWDSLARSTSASLTGATRRSLEVCRVALLRKCLLQVPLGQCSDPLAYAIPKTRCVFTRIATRRSVGTGSYQGHRAAACRCDGTPRTGRRIDLRPVGPAHALEFVGQTIRRIATPSILTGASGSFTIRTPTRALGRLGPGGPAP
jgi:hypothetical protein